MALLGQLMVITLVVIVKAQTYEWKDIDNSCTQLKSSGNIKDIAGETEFWYLSTTNKRLATLSIVPQEDNTYILTINKDKHCSNPKYNLYYEEDTIIANPKNEGQLEGFSMNGTGPIKVAALVASVPDVGFAIVVCDFKPGNVPMRPYVLACPSATQEEVDDLKNKLAAEVPEMSLNPVAHEAVCMKGS
ncbi:hypothetical protein CHUAL_000169 [Chamberlinius hualienensis]